MDSGPRGERGQESASHPRRPSGRLTPVAGPPRRVLIVDDTPEIAELLAFALRDRGYDIATEGYDPDINDVVARHRPDAIVVNCSVYAMSESLFDVLRADDRHADVPVIIITDTPDEAIASLSERQPTHIGLVPKPFTAGQVESVLGQLLGPNEPAPPES